MTVGRIAAAAVAGGTGFRAGAFRPGLDAPHRVDPGDRAAAGTISIISITGIEIGIPEPLLKR